MYNIPIKFKDHHIFCIFSLNILKLFFFIMNPIKMLKYFQ